MDFYKNPAILYKWNVAILIACIVLTGYGTYQIIFCGSEGYRGLVTPVLLGIGMTIEIRKYKKSKNSANADENHP